MGTVLRRNKSYHFYPMAIIYESGKEPWLWSTYDSVTSIEEARNQIKFLFENNPDWRPIMTYIQKYSDFESRKWTVEKKIYVNSLGLRKYSASI